MKLFLMSSPGLHAGQAGLTGGSNLNLQSKMDSRFRGNDIGKLLRLRQKSWRILTMTILISLIFCGNIFSAQASLPAFDILEKIPVQQNGRIKPFQSFAREVTLFITGKSSYEKIPATELVWQWMSQPDQWYVTPFIPVSYESLSREFGLKTIKGKISPEIILQDETFLEKVRTVQAKQQKKEKLTQEEQKRVEIYERAILFRQIVSGEAPGWIANPEDPRAAWLPFQTFSTDEGREALNRYFPAEKSAAVAGSLRQLLETLRSGNGTSVQAAEAANLFSKSLTDIFESRGIVLDQKILGMEITYNHLHPFGWAWKFYLMSALLMTFMSFPRKRESILSQNGSPTCLPAGKVQTFGDDRKHKNMFFVAMETTGLMLFTSGFAMHTYGFYLRCMIAARPPVTNMYESLIWVSWAIAFFSIIFFSIYKTFFISITAGLMASVALLLAEGFPAVLDPSIGPLVPVLRSNLWLTVHVLTITLSYGAFALAWGLGHGVIFSFVLSRGNQELHQKLFQYLYRTLQIGVILLACGTVLGGVWANYSWGRFWGWDPKETWALIALLGYLTVLHGRFAGWLGTFGLAAGSVVAFLGVVMAWYGVNFVLAAGLHSYGFGGGGVYYVAIVALIDLMIVGVISWIYKKSERDKMNSGLIAR